MLTQELEALNAHLDENPEDWDSRRVLADLYEELGEGVLAAGQRWQAANGKCACPPTRRPRPNYWSDGRWHFWSQGVAGLERSYIGDLASLLSCNWYVTAGHPSGYATRAEAEADLARVLRERGWA